MDFKTTKSDLATVRGLENNLHSRAPINQDECSLTTGFRIVMTGLTLEDVINLPAVFTSDDLKRTRRARHNNQSLSI